jgi:AcrR family transcriptional regulator
MKAEEIVQDAFVATYRAWRRMQDGDKALGYLRRAVVTRARSRNAAPSWQPTPRIPGTPLVAVLASLPDRQREALVLTYYADWPESQIAAAMGIGRHALNARIRRGMSTLQIDQTVHLFNNMNMSSDPADLTSSATIRIAAMRLFAERGYAGVTVRQIASAAGVSPALVIHHYGSKERLRAVLEERVASFVESMLAELGRAQEEGASASIAEVFADRLEREPAMAGYVRRLLCDGGPAGAALFERLYQVTRAGMQALEQAGVVRPSGDEQVRDAFLLSNDLAMLLLRPLISQVTGVDPLARDGLVRWSAEVFDVYSGGVFVPAAPKEGGTRDERH